MVFTGLVHLSRELFVMERLELLRDGRIMLFLTAQSLLWARSFCFKRRMEGIFRSCVSVLGVDIGMRGITMGREDVAVRCITVGRPDVSV